MRKCFAFVAVMATSAASVLSAHEFWIEPENYQVEPGQAMTAQLRVGEEMEGPNYSYQTRNFERFDVVMGNDVSPVEGRTGDTPALNVTAETEGLAIIVHQTAAYTLTYNEWPKWERFTKHKDFVWGQTEHRARGLPDVGFKERYIRFAKALIAVGAGQGEDRATGLETEIVALTNPYVDELSGQMSVQVLYQGQARSDAQVELFDKAPDGTVEVTLHRTNADGQATFPVTPGHSYLVDAVVLRPLDPETSSDPVWETLWAALTFAVPE